MTVHLTFNEVLLTKNIDPAYTLVMRHRPQEPDLRRRFRWLALNRPDLFNTFQIFQRERQELQLSKAQYLASFIGHETGKALFIGIYKNNGSEPFTFQQYMDVRENIELRSFGMLGSDSSRTTILRFDLQITELFSDWKGRLIIGWPGGERTWSRWAVDNEFSIESIESRSAIEPEMPNWSELILQWSDLKLPWMSWQSALSHWRGVYFIFDRSDNKGYVGSAYGEENLLGRWTNYADTGHGGNKLLRNRDPNNFVFSILELVSPTSSQTDVIHLEQSWKKRLSTVAPNGLNEN